MGEGKGIHCLAHALAAVGKGGAFDRLIAWVQFLCDWYDSRAFVTWAKKVDDLLLQGGHSEETIANALETAGPVPRSRLGQMAASWLRGRGFLVLYRGQAELNPGSDFLSSVAAGEVSFQGASGMDASLRLAEALQAVGVSPHEMRAMWHSEPVNLPGVPDRLRWQPLGGAGIPFSERLPVAAAYAQHPSERVYVTLQRLEDSVLVHGHGYAWEFERVALHRVSRRTIVLSARGRRFLSFGPPY